MSDSNATATPGQPRTPPSTTEREGGLSAFQLVGLLFLATTIFMVCIHLSWVGYIESDDQFYAAAAVGWWRDAFFLGSTHWGIRHAIVLPMAALFAVFGESETTLLLPSVIYALAVVALLMHMSFRLHGWLAGIISVAVVGSLPAVAAAASKVTTDLPEAFFVIGSVWAFNRASTGARASLFLLSGGMAGAAVITRETSVALLLFYALMFIAGRGREMRGYLWMALGFITVAGLDWTYFTCLSRDPLYRLHMALVGTQADGPQMEVLSGNNSGLDRFGLFDAPRLIKPVIALLSHQGFGLFFWMAIPATVWLAVRGNERERHAARQFGGLALTWFAVLGYGLAPWLWVIPRYFVVCTVLVVPLAITLARAVSDHGSWVAVAVLTLLVGSNITLNLAATTDLMAGERALVTVAARTTETVHTDPATALGAHWLLTLRGLDERVSTDVPGPGSLYFFNNRPRRRPPAEWRIFAPAPDWRKVDEIRINPKWTGVVVRTLGLARALPAGLVAKLDPPPHVMATYRVPTK